MSKLKVAEFADMVGLKAPNVHTYKNRGQLNVVDGLVDTEDPQNKSWIQKRFLKMEMGQVKKNVEATAPDPGNGEVVKGDLFDQARENEKQRDQEIQDVKDQAKKQITEAQKIATATEKLKYEKAQQDLLSAKLKNQKLMGEVIPVDYSQRIFSIHFKNITTSFFNAADNFTNFIVERLGGSREDLSEFRQSLKDSLNQAVDEAKELSRNEIKQAASDYAAKKGKGEHG